MPWEWTWKRKYIYCDFFYKWIHRGYQILESRRTQPGCPQHTGATHQWLEHEGDFGAFWSKVPFVPRWLLPQDTVLNYFWYITKLFFEWMGPRIVPSDVAEESTSGSANRDDVAEESTSGSANIRTTRSRKVLFWLFSGREWDPSNFILTIVLFPGSVNILTKGYFGPFSNECTIRCLP